MVKEIASNISIIINDSKYILPDLELIKSFLEFDNTNNMKYKINANDCDDFSYILYGNFLKEQYNNVSKNFSYLFGIAYGSNQNLNHAFNIFLDSKYIFYCLEPQDDIIVPCVNYTDYNIYQIIF